MWRRKPVLTSLVQLYKAIHVTSPRTSSCFRWTGRNHYASAAAGGESSAVDAGSCVEVHHRRWPHTLRLAYPWLRDHCRCPTCYNSRTFQRSYDLSNLPLNIRPTQISATSDGLELQWPDGHRSHYDYKFLWQSSYEGQQTSHRSAHRLWAAASQPHPDSTMVPADIEATRRAVEHVCAIKMTFFGDMWYFDGNLEHSEHSDTAYSSEFIGAHTDTTYCSQAYRIQVFHCLQPAEEGGETLLVDGFHIAEQFRNKHPDSYQFLCSHALPSEYLEDGQHHIALDTVFKLHPVTGNLQQFRYNIYDRAPLSSLPLEKVQDFYQHYINLTRFIRNSRNEYWLQLEPGKVLLLDNWRVMHGRASFKGRRLMCGCYLDNDEYTSRARVLGLPLH